MRKKVKLNSSVIAVTMLSRGGGLKRLKASTVWGREKRLQLPSMARAVKSRNFARNLAY